MVSKNREMYDFLCPSWVQWLILYERTKQVRGSIPTEVVFPLFLGELPSQR